MHESDQVQRAISGDRAAMSALLAENGANVRNRILGMMDTALRAQFDVDDVMQVSYLEAFLRIGQFDPGRGSSFGAWFQRICENNLRDLQRAARAAKRPPPGGRVLSAPTEESFVSLLEQLDVTHSTPSLHARRNEACALLEAAIAKLPPEYARVVRMFDLLGQPVEEVAKEMKRSVGAVYMLRARAHEWLREALGGSGQSFS